MRFVMIPQWQGSGARGREHLVDGTAAIATLLSPDRTIWIPVPDAAGEALGTGIRGQSSLLEVRSAHALALGREQDAVVTVGGDCGVELAAITHARRRSHLGFAVVWLDAHADLNTAASSPSGAFHGMVLRSFLDSESSAKVILAGTRALDPAERRHIELLDIGMLGVDEVHPRTVVENVAATGAGAVYIHVDLDVLDPSQFDGIGVPEPRGINVTTLLATIEALTERFELAGAGVTEFTPKNGVPTRDDLTTISQLFAALSK